MLDETQDHVRTAECRSALSTTHSVDCQLRVQEWNAKHPLPDEQQAYVTIDEMMLRQSDETINGEMELLHERVIKLRSVTPDVPQQ